MGSRGSMPGVILPANNLLSGVPMGAGSGSLGVHPHQQSDDISNMMDSSMHQSFINLIYPSKSKKLMSSELGGSMIAAQPQKIEIGNHSSGASIP